jgi:UTP--glucose-1-phosphate uridylyltransferase
MISKAVITAAGLGTRLLSATKAQPKEMLPVFARAHGGGICMKPIVQLVYEDLFRCGFRDFCFVVGRGQSIIREHFNPDPALPSTLAKNGKNGLAEELKKFNEMLEQSSIEWATQPSPRGFGDAVMRAESFVGDDTFLVHAGDNFFISKDLEHLRHLLQVAHSLSPSATFLVQQVEDPSSHGIVEPEEEAEGLIRVRHVVEKPLMPSSRLGIMPVYVFQRGIFARLKQVRPGYAGELQLTDGIERSILSGGEVYGVLLDPNVIRIDVGSPSSYMEAQSLSYTHASMNLDNLDHSRPNVAPVPEVA